MRRILLAGICTCLLAACGKKGPPLPPDAVPPVLVRGLEIAQRGDELAVRFDLPATYPDGEPFVLQSLRVEAVLTPRPEEPDPTAAELLAGARQQAPDGSLPVPASAGLARHDVDGEQRPRLGTNEPGVGLAVGATLEGRRRLEARFAGEGRILGVLEGEQLGPAIRGDRVLLSVPLPEERDQLAVVRVKVRGERKRAREATSKLAMLALAPTEAAPPTPKVANQPDGLEVRSEATEEVALAVFRVDADGRPVELEPASVLAERRAWTDRSVDEGASACYATARVVGAGQGERYSQLSAAACAERSDVFAPGAPARLRAYPSREGLLLVWAAPAATVDVAGYHVYRADTKAAAGFVRLTAEPIAERRYLDSDVETGRTYAYEVTALDDADPPNESERSERLVETAAAGR